MERQKIRILKIFERGVNQQDRVILDYESLEWLVGVLKLEGKKVGYTSGVYDLFHVGHAKYLEKSKEKCDVLIVAIDSDELVQSRKGPDRPIVKLEERIDILVRNRSVDIITVRNVEDDPFMLIKKIKPNVLIFSETTKDTANFIAEMKEAYKGDVDDIIVFKPQATTSTTARIRKLTIDGSKELAEKINKVVSEHFKEGGDS